MYEVSEESKEHRIVGLPYHRRFGKVRDIRIEREDHGILTFWVEVDFGDSRQGFGGFALDQPGGATDKRRIGSAAGTDMILRLMDLFNVDRLDKAIGRVVVAIRSGFEAHCQIMGLEIPKFEENGGARLMISDWQKRWGFPSSQGG